MLQVNTKLRITPANALNHKWFKTVLGDNVNEEAFILSNDVMERLKRFKG
jgi:hypothetical protein